MTRIAAILLIIIAFAICTYVNLTDSAYAAPDAPQAHGTPTTVIVIGQAETTPQVTLDALQATPTETPTIYDIALSEDLQRYTYDVCTQYGVDYEMVLAVMHVESSYRVKVISHGNYGLMQINKINHKRLKAELGITDFLDARQNILAGVHMLAELQEKYMDANRVLMAYNRGEHGASHLWAKGIYSTKYSRAVMERAAELRATT
jgi:soluble lytic murein transglycosylase-like protein